MKDINLFLYAQIIITALPLILSSAAHSSYTSEAFKQINTSVYNEMVGSIQVEDKKLPRSYSQDSFGNCYAMTAAYILDAANCRTDDPRKPEDRNCKTWPEERSFSRLDIARYTKDIPDKKQMRDFYQGISEGGSPKKTVANVFERKMSVVSHKCSSLDKLLTNFGDTPQLKDAQEKGWDLLRKTYDTYKTQDPACATCRNDIVSTAKSEIYKNFNIKRDNQTILKAFAEESYSKFLDKLLIPEECEKDDHVYLENRDRLKLRAYPEKDSDKSTYEGNIDTIKNILQTQTPILINNVCLGSKFDAKQTQNKLESIIASGKNASVGTANSPATSTSLCEDSHSVVVTGYRKICKKGSDPEIPGNCRDSLKIENSWGAGWQRDNNDGWVDARPFLDRTAYLGQNLVWIEDTKK